LLGPHDRKPLFEASRRAPKGPAKAGVELFGTLAPALEQEAGKPIEPCEMLGRKVRVLLGQPFERHLSLAPAAGGSLNGTEPLPVFRTHRAFQLRAIRA
jgi:hypothetical protein